MARVKKRMRLKLGSEFAMMKIARAAIKCQTNE
jgi:hypothetical protein